jgi:hypothetical protein
MMFTDDDIPPKGRVAIVDINILLLADFASTDTAGKLNIIGAFNSIQSAKFPLIYPQFFLVVRLVAGLGEFDEERTLRIEFLDQDGTKMGDLPPIRFKVPPPKAGMLGEHTAILGFQGLPFPKPGRYEFRVYVDRDQKGSTPLDIALIETQPLNEQ